MKVKEKEKVSLKDNKAALIFSLSGILCFTVSSVMSFFSIDVSDHKAVAGRLFFTGGLSLLTIIFTFISAIRYRHKDRSFPVRLLISIVLTALIGILVFQVYISPLPQLCLNGLPNPVNDIRSAFDILNDDSEPKTVTGIFRQHTYTSIVTGGNGEVAYTIDRFTLEGEKGLEIITSGADSGIYSVTYSPETMLPYSIEPYDFNCGENVLEWTFDSSQLEDWDAGYKNAPPIQGVECVRLERPFPDMMLRITHNGTITSEKRFTDGDKDISLFQSERSPGKYTAQLYAVLEDIYYSNTKYIPISNAAVLTLE